MRVGNLGQAKFGHGNVPSGADPIIIRRGVGNMTPVSYFVSTGARFAAMSDSSTGVVRSKRAR